MSKANRKAKYDLYSKEAPHRLSDALKAEFGEPQTAEEIAAKEAEAKKIAEEKLEADDTAEGTEEVTIPEGV